MQLVEVPTHGPREFSKLSLSLCHILEAAQKPQSTVVHKPTTAPRNVARNGSRGAPCSKIRTGFSKPVWDRLACTITLKIGQASVRCKSFGMHHRAKMASTCVGDVSSTDASDQIPLVFVSRFLIDVI